MPAPTGSDPASHDGPTPAAHGTGRKPNRLAHEASPYLLQHAFNPVDWWPWGEAAFAEARHRGVPILLSVGYSTCYWCHVMERESFENDAIAREMNARFVCIKLDREEHPEIDDAYMSALVIMTGRGGWPMNVFLEPATLRPFWCGTYFPPEPRTNLPAWPQVVERLSAAWAEQRDGVLAQAERVADAVKEHLSPSPSDAEPSPSGGAAVGHTQVTEAVGQLLRSFDRTEGGFGSAPKFPQPALLEFLLAVRPLASDDSTKDAIDEAVTRTLNKMACGGMFDQAGGGFHRYSVDARWLVPHFEKMLYDNAQLARVYARASADYGDDFYANIASRILEYILREMTGPRGGFYAAQDAEVDGREGLNYLWTAEQFRRTLEPADSALAQRVYGLDQGPNFQDPHHPDEPSGNILRLDDRPERTARALNSSHAEFTRRLNTINGTLYAARQTRKQPRLDDKAIASWNGLAIGALVTGGTLLARPEFVAAAEHAADFLRSEMWDGSTLFRSWREGRRGAEGVLEDYACVIGGLLDLHEAEHVPSSSGKGAERTLQWAEQLAEAAHARFSDASGRYFDTRADRTDLFVRTSSTSDGALPTGLSVMLNALLGLGRATGKTVYLERAGLLLRGMSRAVADSPVGAVNAVRAIARILTDPAFESVAQSLSMNSSAATVPAPSAADPFLALEVYASVDRVPIAPDRPGLLRLVLRVADGYHVIAAQPNADGESPTHRDAPDLTPFRVSIVGGTGVRAYADYPRGEKFAGPATFGEDAPAGEHLGSPMVYQGTVEFDVAIEREGEWTGRPMLVLTYQACSDTECLPVRTTELDVALDRE